MQKIKLFHRFLVEIELIKKSHNPIARQYFDPYLKNKNFPTYEISAGTHKIITILIIEDIQLKLMTKSFNKLKKYYFWPIFPIF